MTNAIDNERRARFAGEVLRVGFLKLTGMSTDELAEWTHLPAEEASGIVIGQRSVVPDTAARQSHLWGICEGFFARVQDRYDRESGEYRLDREAR